VLPAGYFITFFHTLQAGRLPAIGSSSKTNTNKSKPSAVGTTITTS